MVADARRGRLRVPPFQRDIKWDAEDVSMLLDSLFSGYPIGSLLFWRGPQAPAGPAHLGPVLVAAPDPNVTWIVDGQQRIVSMVGSFTAAGSADPRFDQWFDPDKNKFQRRPRAGPEVTWIPVWRLLDAAELGEFLLGWASGTPARRRAALEAGQRLREYRIPASIIESTDDVAVRAAFQRLNQRGKALQSSEVFDAWAAPGNSLADLGAESDRLGWGVLDDDLLLRAVLVNEGKDPTKPVVPEGDQLGRAVDRVRRGLAGTISFLRSDAGIPDARWLPYNTAMQVLPAFFARHPDPDARSRTLLTRWVWRVMASADPGNKVVIRAAAKAASSDSLRTESDRVQAIVHTAAPDAIRPWTFKGVRFRSDSGSGRIAMVALASLGPVDLTTGAPLDIANLAHGPGDPTRFLVSGPRAGTLLESVANRVLHPPTADGVDLLELVREWRDVAGENADALRSHAVSPEGMAAVDADDVDTFLTERGKAIERVVAAFLDRMAAPGHSDRPGLRRRFAS